MIMYTARLTSYCMFCSKHSM